MTIGLALVGCGAGSNGSSAGGSESGSSTVDAVQSDTGLGGGTETETGGGIESADCVIPEYADDMEFDYGKGVSAPHEITRMAPHGDFLLACGAGFVTSMNGSTLAQVSLDLEGRCMGVSAVSGTGPCVDNRRKTVVD